MFLHASAGPVVLFAGDEVPEGFEVGAHLLADDEPDEAEGEGHSVEELAAIGLILQDDFTSEGGVADESGDPYASEGPAFESEPGPADDGEGDQPELARPKRTRGPAKA